MSSVYDEQCLDKEGMDYVVVSTVYSLDRKARGDRGGWFDCGWIGNGVH